MNRNIRVTHIKSTLAAKNGAILVRDLDMIDNAFLLQIDAVGFGRGDIRNSTTYEHPTIQYRVRVEQLATSVFPAEVIEFVLSSCPCTRLTNIPLWLANIPVEALVAYDDMTSIKNLMNMVFSHCVGAGKLSLAMTLLDSGWVNFNGHHTIDAQHNDTNETVRIQFEVKRGLVRYKRTTLVEQLSATTRQTSIIPFNKVWPEQAPPAHVDIFDQLAKILVELGNGEPRTFTTVERDDLTDSELLIDPALNIWQNIYWSGSVTEIIAKLNNYIAGDEPTDRKFEYLSIGPYSAILYKNVVVICPDEIDA